MQTYVSFLRGINVGGRTIKMADLKLCYEKAGFAEVSTLLQSGNVTFLSSISSTEEVENRLEQAVGAQFGYAAKILVVQRDALPVLVANYPFDSSDANYQHYLVFLRPGLLDDLLRDCTGLDPAVEAVAGGDDVLYWKVLKGMTLKSAFAKILLKAKYKECHTSRNINTVRKLL